MDELVLEAAAEGTATGMVVEWCKQVRVLAHPAVACFVMHCEWNLTLEAMAAGVPVVAASSWSDQPTNAHLVEEEWGVGVRALRDADRVLLGEELARCVELVSGDGETVARVRANDLRALLPHPGPPPVAPLPPSCRRPSHPEPTTRIWPTRARGAPPPPDPVALGR